MPRANCHGGGAIDVTDQHAHFCAANAGVGDLAQGLVGELDKRRWREARGGRRHGRTLVRHKGWKCRRRRQWRLRAPDFGRGPCPDPKVGCLSGRAALSDPQTERGCGRCRRAPGKLCEVRPRHDVLPEARRKTNRGMRRGKPTPAPSSGKGLCGVSRPLPRTSVAGAGCACTRSAYAGYPGARKSSILAQAYG